MTIKRRKFASAVSLVEVMVATVVLSIITIGAMSYEYHASRDATIARAQIAATRTAQLLLEDWMSTGGSIDYNPSTLGLGFSAASAIPSSFSDQSGLGLPQNNAVYAITVDEMPILVMLTRKDIAQDIVTGAVLRQLGVVVEFGTLVTDKDAGRLENIPPLILTTYVRADASGG